MFYRKTFKKIIFTLLLLFGTTFTPFFCNAFWPADWALNASMTEMLAKMNRMIEGAIISALKQTAIQTINQTVGNAISGGSGGSGGAMFVTNWRDFLINEPAEKTNLYMNDFFSQITSGRGNSSNYQSSDAWSGMGQYFSSSQGEPFNYEPGVEGVSTAREGVVQGSINIGGLGGNYENYLINQAKKITIEQLNPKTDIRNYVSDPSQMFSTGNWRAFTSFISNPANNPFGFSLIAQEEYHSKLAQEQMIRQTEGAAYKGFKALKSGENILTPGSTIADIQSQTEDLGNKILAAAETPSEVITSLVTRMLTKTIQQGIGQAQQKVQREINSKVNNYSGEFRKIQNPSQLFKSSY